MKITTRTLKISDCDDASKLDKHWFGKYGISADQLASYILNNEGVGLTLLANDKFEGFATFEVLEGKPPKDYVGNIPKIPRVLFIQQFTTSTNYSKQDTSMDGELLKAIEKRATKLNCGEAWEALATEHPYSSAVNPSFDAFGFYLKNEFIFDPDNRLIWSPGGKISIPCYLFRKKLTL